MNTREIIEFIKNSKKKTPCELITDEYIADTLDCKVIGKDLKFIIGEYSQIEKIIKDNSLKNYHIKVDRRNSAIPLLDVKNINARIEPGAIIRDNVTIGNNSVIMMGAVINIGAVIGDNSMIDMNAVLGGRAIVGKNCHVGAGAVLAGVIEPESAKPVELEDNVLIGANAVVLEGVKIKKGSVVAAGSVVIEDVQENSVVAGIPARLIKVVDEKTKNKTSLVEELRKL